MLDLNFIKIHIICHAIPFFPALIKTKEKGNVGEGGLKVKHFYQVSERIWIYTIQFCLDSTFTIHFILVQWAVSFHFRKCSYLLSNLLLNPNSWIFICTSALTWVILTISYSHAILEVKATFVLFFLAT